MAKKSFSISVPFAKVTPVKPANGGFSLVKVWICATGKNRNMSYISQEELDAAIPSLAYVPVVGHLMEKVDKDGKHIGYCFGGHDMELTEDWELRPLTVPFGVVTADAPAYETVVEYGKERQYLTAYAYLWTERYPEMLEATYSNEVWFAQSMELHYDQSEPLEEDSNYTELHDLEFSALCILGKSDDPKENVEPCFISSKIAPVTFDLQGEQFNQLMAELRKQLSFCFVNDASRKGGNEKLSQETIAAIFAEMGLEQSAVALDITDDMTEDQLRAALEPFKAGDPEPEADPEPAPEGDPEPEPVADPEPAPEDGGDGTETFAATANQKRDALRNALDPVIVRDPAGNLVSETYYWVEDFDDSYCYVERNTYTPGNSECLFGRFAYSFDDTSKTASITGSFEEMVKMWLTKAEAAALEAERDELAQLRTYKQDVEKTAYQAKVDEVKAEFEDLSGLEAFSKVFDEAADIDELRLRLFALRGQQVKVERSPNAKSHVKVVIEPEDAGASAVPYGGLFEKYGPRAKKH